MNRLPLNFTNNYHWNQTDADRAIQANIDMTFRKLLEKYENCYDYLISDESQSVDKSDDLKVDDMQKDDMINDDLQDDMKDE